MQDIFFSIGRFLQDSFDYLLVPFQMIPNWIFVIIMAIGAIYWLMLQGKYNKKARKEGTLV